jgi:hypothetical protein
MLAAVLLIFSLLILTTSYQQPITVSSSNILQELAQRKKSQPAITSKELAVVANELLEKRGFDYGFHLCEELYMRKSTDITARSSRTIPRTRTTPTSPLPGSAPETGPI